MGLFTGALRSPVIKDQPTASASPNAPGQAAGTDANHLFANNVRFLSMAAIIAGHTVPMYAVFRHPNALPLVLTCLVQLFKFGTIGFFLISGFLFGERIDQYTPLQYYARRLKNVFLPWLVWYLCYCGLRIAVDVVQQRFSFHSSDAFGYLYTDLVQIGLLSSTYWFVPNLLIALAILLVFRRVLRDKRIGAAFAVASLVYAANIYGHWFPVQHSRAFFGFVFYLWLGAWGSWHFATVEKWLARVPVAVMLGVVVLAHGLAMGEAQLLVSLHSVDPVNTLRITNQIYSIVAVLAIMKLKHPAWPRFVDVRAHTFGLYLIHPIGLATTKEILPHVVSAAFLGKRVGAALSLPLVFIMTYGGCLLAIRGLLSCSWLRWTVGLAGQRRAAASMFPVRSSAGEVLLSRPQQKAALQGRPSANPEPLRL
jgi:peptidoglycan/LPS O-acetylase OafA/YrhL